MKKAIAVLLVLVMVLGVAALSGCGQKSDKIVLKICTLENEDHGQGVLLTTFKQKVEENVFNSTYVKFAVRFPENQYVDFRTDYEYMESFTDFYVKQAGKLADKVYKMAVEQKLVLKTHLIHVAIKTFCAKP